MDKKCTDYSWQRSPSNAVGKGDRRISKQKYKTLVSVYMDYFGEYGTIRWFCAYPDLAAFEKLANQLITDQEYIEKLKSGTGLLTPGSAFATVMRSI